MTEATNLCIALFNAASFTLFDILSVTIGCSLIGWVGRMTYDMYRETL